MGVRGLFTDDDVVGNLRVVKQFCQTENSGQTSLVQLIKQSHAFAWWVEASGLGDNYRQLTDFKVTKPFWRLCQKFGFEFTSEEKLAIISHYRQWG